MEKRFRDYSKDLKEQYPDTKFTTLDYFVNGKGEKEYRVACWRQQPTYNSEFDFWEGDFTDSLLIELGELEDFWEYTSERNRFQNALIYWV